MDMRDGEIRVRTVVEGAGDLGGTMIERAMASNLKTTSRYLAALLAIGFGNAAPSAVIELAERGEEAKLQ